MAGNKLIWLSYGTASETMEKKWSSNLEHTTYSQSFRPPYLKLPRCSALQGIEGNQTKRQLLKKMPSPTFSLKLTHQSYVSPNDQQLVVAARGTRQDLQSMPSVSMRSPTSLQDSIPLQDWLSYVWLCLHMQGQWKDQLCHITVVFTSQSRHTDFIKALGTQRTRRWRLHTTTDATALFILQKAVHSSSVS